MTSRDRLSACEARHYFVAFALCKVKPMHLGARCTLLLLQSAQCACICGSAPVPVVHVRDFHAVVDIKLEEDLQAEATGVR